jgi:hypothetical protein
LFRGTIRTIIPPEGHQKVPKAPEELRDRPQENTDTCEMAGIFSC